MKPWIYVNDRLICNDSDAMILLVNDDGGGRLMIRADFLAERLTNFGTGHTLGVMHEPFVLRDEDGNQLRYANLSNRHHQVMFSSGDSQERHWAMNPNNGSWDDEYFDTFDVRPVAGGTNGVPGTPDQLYVPVRWAIDGLGGVISSTDPDIRVDYADDFITADWLLAGGSDPGLRAAFNKGYITTEQVYSAGDTTRFIAYRDSLGDVQWARQNPWLYIRSLGIKQIAKNGRPLTEKDYESIAALARVKFGDPVYGADQVTASASGRGWDAYTVKQLINLTERAAQTMAEQFGLQESGIDSLTGQHVDFSEYNRQHTENPFWNGPDKIYVAVDSGNIIQRYMIGEIKVSMRPYIRPSRFLENSTLEVQVGRMLKWNDPIVRAAAKDLQGSLEALRWEVEMGRMTPDEYAQVFKDYYKPVRVTASPQGGSSKATKAQYNRDGIAHVELTLEANLPPEGEGLYRMAPPSDDDKDPEGLLVPSSPTQSDR